MYHLFYHNDRNRIKTEETLKNKVNNIINSI